MFGNIAIYTAFFFTLSAALIYGLSFFFQRDRGLPFARYSYYLKTAAVTAASIYLLWGLLAHKFQYFYVYYHSSTDLPLEYLISAFWAGQEGTFLLWVLLAAFFGLFIIRWEKEYESPVMFFLLVGQAFLLLFLILYSPFRLMPGIPLEGVGLNPLLIDPWMVIHPPIIFVGYAALLLPAAFAFGGLWKKDYQGWASRALPWALTGWLFLGAGIIIGGYWAYRTLGWGGYWGWDPVENASLVPWLTGTALIHGILLQKARSVSYRSNLFFAYITFVLVIYATFLTRSGILADFSVHAFTETGLNPYMLAFMLFYFLVGTALLLLRFGDIPGTPAGENWYSRVSTFSYTALLLTVSSVLITLGTSSPILTGIWGEPASVDISFYNLTNAPIAVLLALVLAFCPLLSWRDEDPKEIMRKLKGPALFTLAGLVLSIILGVYSPLKLAFLGASLLALGTNSLVLFPAFKRGIKNSGGFLAHVGLALMFIGILTSSALSHSHIISLKEGEFQEALGYEFTLISNTVVNDKEAFEIQVEKGGRVFTATPKMYMAGKEPRLMREPYILRGLHRDLYLSPLEERLDFPGETVTMAVGEKVEIEGYTIEFVKFDFDAHEGSGRIKVGVLLNVEKDGIVEQVVPFLESTEQGVRATAEDLPGGVDEVVVEALDANERIAIIRVSAKDSPPPAEMLILEVSYKPLVSVLAFGSVILMVGTSLAVWRRFSKYFKG